MLQSDGYYIKVSSIDQPPPEIRDGPL